MGAMQQNNGSTPAKWIFITVSTLCAGLIIASIWSLSRALFTSSPHCSIASSNEVAEMNTGTGPSREEIARRQYAITEQQAAAIIQTPIAAKPQPPIVRAKRNKDAIRLRKVKNKVNRKLVERLKQYVKDHPFADNRELEKQIKKREAQTQ